MLGLRGPTEQGSLRLWREELHGEGHLTQREKSKPMATWEEQRDKHAPLSSSCPAGASWGKFSGESEGQAFCTASGTRSIQRDLESRQKRTSSPIQV